MKRTTVLGVAAVASAPALIVLGWLGAAHLRYVRFHRRAGLALPPFLPGDAARYYGETLVGVARCLVWRFVARGEEGWRVPPGAGGTPVVCLHGYLMNATALNGLRRRLEAWGRPTRAVFLGSPGRTIEGYVSALEAALEETARRFPGRSIDVVAHSMGGLVLRSTLALRPDLGGNLRRIVTLGTPHHGTPVSHSLPAGPEVLQMGPGSAFLESLPTFAETAPGATVITVAAGPDLVVYPRAAALLAGSEQVILDGVSHLGLITDERALALVVRLLTSSD